MNDRRANIARNILALGAMFGGMPIYGGVPRARPEPIVHPEAQAIAIDLGVSYADAERVWLRFGAERAREVLTVCLEHNVVPDNDLLRLLEPEPTTGEQLRELARATREIEQLTRRNDILDLAIYGNGDPPRRALDLPLPVPKKRPLAEKKARRAKRKQRGKR